ncbi:MAG: RloB family protein, partial [Pseudomonadota bacterium]
MLCEDTKSSLVYLQDAARHFRSYAEVEIVHCGKNDPLNIVREAIQQRRNYDKVYCAIDRDRHEGFDAALALAAENAQWLSVIVSYPCYEFWLLLHFRMTRSPYIGVGKNSAGDLLVRALCDEDGMAAYDKGGSEKLFDKLIQRLPVARQRAA